MAPLPHDLFGAAAASDGTYAYVFGGYTFNGRQTLDTVYRYNPATKLDDVGSDAAEGARWLGGLLPGDEQDLRLRGLGS